MQRVTAITGMRGVAALLVVGFHAVLVVYLAQVTLAGEGKLSPADVDAFRHPASAGFFGGGWVGVDFFFVLSGFLLAGPLLAAPRVFAGWASYRLYAAKRLLRIAPPYYASFLLGWLLVGWSKHPAYLTTLRGLLVHALYLHNFFRDDQFAINGAYWTLAVELQFYLALPLLVLPFRRWGLLPAAGFAGLAVLYLVWAYQPEDALRTRFLAFQFPAFLGHFGFGIAAAALARRRWKPRIPPDAMAFGAILMLLVLPALWLGYTRQFEAIDEGPFASTVYHLLLRPAAGLAFALTIVAVLQPDSVLGRILSMRGPQWVGDVSYSLYLVHLPLGGVLLILDPALVVRIGVPLYIVLMMAGSLLMAYALYRAVELPSLRLKDRVAARLQPSPPQEAAAHA